MATVIAIVESGDLDAVESWASVVDRVDYPVFIEIYQQTHDWKQKNAIAFLLSRQNDPSLEPLFLDYMSHIDTKKRA